MGDNMRKVRTGDALDIPAETFNTFIDSARDFLQRQSELNRSGSRDTRNSGIVLMKNASGSDRERFHILGIKEPVIKYSDNEDVFKNHIALTGEMPDEEDHIGKFAILLEPLKSGSIGKAMVLGVCVVKLDVGKEEHTHADMKDAEAATLKTGFYGAAQILWKEEGTGEKWAVVRLNAVPPRNLHADDAENTYEIDRTSEGDDDKEWNPANEKPEDWADYDCVKLTVEYLRYDSSAGTLKRVKQEFHWAAGCAPVIPAADISSAETGNCDE